MAAREFTIDVSDDELADLRRRLAATRWPKARHGAGWEQGTDVAWLRALCEYWADGYDWREQEQRLNALPQRTVEVDGFEIHCVVAPGRWPNPRPLVLTHGWPSTFFEFVKVIGPLSDPAAYGGDPADAFDVIVPSLPGYGFSSAPTEPGVDTARIAVQAALTGPLVLSTLHTNDAPGAVTRLFNIGIEPYLVGASLAGVMAQRLVRKLCQHCKEGYEPNVNERRQIEKLAGNVDTLYKAKGCPKCKHLGFSGRIGIYELLVPDDNLIERISNGATLNEIRHAATALGMKPLRNDGMEKVRAGITTLEEIYRVTA